MTDVRTLGKTAWRDHVTDGVASSGPHDPLKSEIRAFVDAVDLVVATRAAFRALTGSPEAILVRCNSVPTDGWGGIFFRDDADTTTVDDGALVVVNAAGKRYKRQFNPGEFFAAWWGVVADAVTSCDIALRDACVAAKGGSLRLPKGRILLNGAGGVTVHTVNIRIIGQGALNWSGAGPEGPEYNDLQHWGDFGTTFLLTSTTVQPFTWDDSVTFEHCNFFWPNQTGQYTTPIVYPPLITDRGVNYDNNGGVSNNVFINCSVINAYQFMKQSAVALTWGNIRVLFCDIYSIECDFELRNVAEQFFVMGCVFNPSLWAEGSVAAGAWSAGISNGSVGAGTILNVTSMQRGRLGPGAVVSSGAAPNTTITGYLSATGLTGTYTVDTSQFVAPGTVMNFGLPMLEWTRANGRWLRIRGNGSHSVASTELVGGFGATNNIVYGRRRAVEVVDGALDFATFDPSQHFDGCAQVFYCANAGTVAHTRFLGTYYSFAGNLTGGATNYGCFELDDPAAGAAPGGCSIEVSGDLRGGNGTFFQAIGNNIIRVVLSGLDVGNWGGSSLAGTYYAVNINAPNADVRISDATFFTGSVGVKGSGIYVPASKSVMIVGAQFMGVNKPIDLATNASPRLISGCQATGTQSTFSAYGTLGANLVIGHNGFDKPNAAFDSLLRDTGGGIRGSKFFYGTDTQNSGAAITLALGAANGIHGTVASGNTLLMANNPAAAIYQVGVFQQNGVQVGSITAGVSTTAFNTSSDENLKEHVVDAGDPLALLSAMRVVSFDWKFSNEHVRFGVLAQQIYEIFPEAVTPPDPRRDYDPATNPWQIDMSKLIPMLLGGINRLNQRLAALEAQ